MHTRTQMRDVGRTCVCACEKQSEMCVRCACMRQDFGRAMFDCTSAHFLAARKKNIEEYPKIGSKTIKCLM